DGHEVSQENGWGLKERGTVAIRRMVPPQSGQMAKSVVGSGRSPWVRFSTGSHGEDRPGVPVSATS
ncbi:MAG TPA: hypothetical protein VGI22_10575, partial [Xanthobacteraceae bacterium]